MVHLVKVNAKNVWEIIGLKVDESQKNFVAPNDRSMIEAYTTIAANGYVFSFGIYDDETPVGFLMIGYDVDDEWEDAPVVAKGNYNIWRLMIDKRWQNRGYGRRAMELALAFVRSFPCGEAALCWLSYEPENIVAKQLYHSLGFVETREWDGKEKIAVLKL